MFSMVINNGFVVDGTNRKGFYGNIGIEDGKIKAISKEQLQGKKVIDATGKIVAPGFIDPHGHVDGHEYAGELSACQGITTTIGGNCGLSPIAMNSFFEHQDSIGFPIHQAELVGHSFSLRKEVGIINEHAKATNKQIEEMARLAEIALKEGACGISFGLDYAPGSSIDEIKELVKVCSFYNKVCPIHSRLVTERDMNSLYELFSIAKETNATFLLSHFVYQYSASGIHMALRLVDKARENGLRMHMDSGMYTSWATYAGTATFEERSLKTNDLRLENIIVASGPYFGKRLNKELYYIMRNEYPQESLIYEEGTKEDVYACLKKSYCMPSTDIGAYKKGEGHPQIAGTFPKYIKEMVIDNKFLSIEECIYKGTKMPANLFGIKNKGTIEEGMDGDIIIFDLNRIEDKAKFPNEGYPDEKPVGMDYVIVNGQCVVENSVFTGSRSGRCIKLR